MVENISLDCVEEGSGKVKEDVNKRGIDNILY